MGDTIRARRLLRQFTAPDLARVINRSKSLIHEYRNGHIDLRLEHIMRLHRHTGIPLGAFFTAPRREKILHAAQILESEGSG